MLKTDRKFLRGEKILLVLIVVFLAAFLRFYRLDIVSLFGDEVDIGYNAYTLLKTGKDVSGHFFPVYLQTIIDTKPSLLAYFLTIPIKLIGLNEISVRSVSALSGVLSVFLTYLLVKELFGNFRLSLLSSFFLAISPWHLHFSRGTFEVNLTLSLLLLAVFLFFKSFSRNSLLLISGIVFGLSFYAYHSAKLLVPVLILDLVIFNFKKLKSFPRAKIFASLALLVLISLPVFYNSVFGLGQERFKEVNLFSNPKIVDRIISERVLDKQNPLMARFFHNKGVEFFKALFQNYLESFSPQFLFLYGDPNFRHSVGQMGELYYFDFPFWAIGFYFFLKERKKAQKFLLFWFLLAPLPALITRGGGWHAIRLFAFLPVVQIMTAYGFLKVVFLVKKPRTRLGLVGFLLILIVLNFSFYFHRYLVHYPFESWRHWHFGYKEAMIAISEYESDYDLVLINNNYEPSILWFLFWNEYDPLEVQSKLRENFLKEDAFSGLDGFNLGKFWFVKPNTQEWKNGWVEDLLRKSNKNILFLASHERDTGGGVDWRINPPEGIKVLKTISSPDDWPIFYLLTAEI